MYTRAESRGTLEELVGPDAAARGHVVQPRQVPGHKQEKQQQRSRARAQRVRPERAQLHNRHRQRDRVLQADIAAPLQRVTGSAARRRVKCKQLHGESSLSEPLNSVISISNETYEQLTISSDKANYI